MGWAGDGLAANNAQYGTINEYLGSTGLDGLINFLLDHTVVDQVFARSLRRMIHLDVCTQQASIIISSMTVDQAVSRTPVFDAGEGGWRDWRVRGRTMRGRRVRRCRVRGRRARRRRVETRRYHCGARLRGRPGQGLTPCQR